MLRAKRKSWKPEDGGRVGGREKSSGYEDEDEGEDGLGRAVAVSEVKR
jgi:hypothetical protein